MSASVWKFPLPIADDVVLEMPVGARVLAVDTQHETICLWALVDPDAETQQRGFCVRGTGHPFTGSEGEYLGTAMLRDGVLVFHVFEAVAS